MNRSLTISLLSALTLGGCASPLKLKNVAGTWSCPRVDGVCSDITSIDRGLGIEETGTQPVGNGGLRRDPGTGTLLLTSMGSANPIMPGRTADQVARIVFAPSVDANGHYHGPREIYAVMTTGSWVTQPVRPVPDLQPAVLRSRPKAASGGAQTAKSDVADEPLELSAAQSTEVRDDR